VIVVPRGNNPEKDAAMRAYGAELIEHGRDFDEARIRMESLADSEGMTMVHSANEPHLINGVGTYCLEILEDLPDVDAIVVPVGGGSAVCGAITVFRALRPEVRIYGVQAERAPSIYLSWKRGERVETARADTFADGLATRVPFELTFEIIREGVDAIVLASEAEMREAILTLLRTTHNLAEGAGAAPFAAIAKLRGELQGKKVVGVLSGGNLDAATLRKILRARGAPRGLRTAGEASSRTR
jgi:threonine dehydratase